jgi:hypothetical protein
VAAAVLLCVACFTAAFVLASGFDFGDADE